MYILGISCFYHDAAACLIRDGDILAAAQEERFTRKKHDPSFPVNAVNYCLDEAGITIKDVEIVSFYDKPLIKFERILETYLAYVPFGFRSFVKSIPLWIKKKIWISDLLSKELDYKGKIIFPEHHESHAASAFFPSPFENAAIITMDGVGEWATASYGIGDNNKIELHAEIKFPHSLGLLYSAFTYYIGFKVNSGEYKLMGLAPYGEPKYFDEIMKNLVDLKEDGSFRLNMKYFDYCSGLKMTNKKFDGLFGSPPRKPESKIEQRHMDIAASIQKVTEEIMLRISKHVYKETGRNDLCLAGGVALNCVGNGRILREGPFDNIWIQPASGDAGAALGAALIAWYQYLDHPRSVANIGSDLQKGSYLGPSYEHHEIKEYLEKNNIAFKEIYNETVLAERVSELISNGNVIGWFQGRMEFGPRALGNRSILGDARSLKMQSIINQKIKFRESFRPFAPSVLDKNVSEYFEFNKQSPYMLLVAPVKADKRKSVDNKNLIGWEKMKVERSTIPAVTHVDYSARIQTVHKETNPLYYKLIEKFNEKTGIPVLINTSFNVRGEPIVCFPEDAFKCFMRTNMDYLVMGRFLLDKTKQKDKDKYKHKEEPIELD